MGYGKAAANLAKHGVSFEDAARLFEEGFSATFPGSDHSRGENRLITYGLVAGGGLLVVFHTERGDQIRIISARLATKKERQRYEN